MSYGDIELGVECALPARLGPPAPPGRARRFLRWLAAVLGRRG